MIEKKLLLIEDNMVAQIAAKELLTRAGYTVDIAEDGTDGVNLFRYYKYEIVLVDLHLPDINGFEVAKRIRNHEKSSHSTPATIVALSNNTDDYSLKSYAEAGIDKVLSKPLRNVERIKS